MTGFDLGLLIPLAAFAMVSWLVYTVIQALRFWMQQRASNQFQAKLLDRIGSVGELGAFLNSEGGERFLQTLQVESAGPQLRILRAMQSGVVITALGAGLLLYGWFTPQFARAVLLVAVVFLALGIGFLVSAKVSYRLSRDMGLLDADARRAATRTDQTT